MISIHALLAESDEVPRGCCVTIAVISIHALLAESDPPAPLTLPPSANFYPRSPCGERPVAGSCRNGVIGFLSTLSLRRATVKATAHICRDAFLSTLSLRRATGNQSGEDTNDGNFYPRSPCGERPAGPKRPKHRTQTQYFYPRSPCGERRQQRWLDNTHRRISIHALLAESDESRQPSGRPTTDFYPRSPCGERLPTDGLFFLGRRFLSTLSLRRATNDAINGRNPDIISIHALLAESDFKRLGLPGWLRVHFYPRSPCGERLAPRLADMSAA